MRLYFKQRLFSWFDSYDIYDDSGAAVYTVEGQLAWGHCLHILDAAGNHVGTVKERVLTFLPKFEMYLGGEYVGSIQKEFTFFTRFNDLFCNVFSETIHSYKWWNKGITVNDELCRITAVKVKLTKFITTFKHFIDQLECCIKVNFNI